MAEGTSRNTETYPRDYSLFQPDTLSSFEYEQNFRRKVHLEPERRLMLAVLEDAVQCFQKYLFASSAQGRRLFEEAEAWFRDDDDDWFFSFDSVCSELGITPSYFRRGLFDWKTQMIDRRQRRMKSSSLAGSARRNLSH